MGGKAEAVRGILEALGEAVPKSAYYLKAKRYSPTARAAAGLKQNKGTWQQFEKQLLALGAKPDEIQWTGLAEAMSGKKTINKQEILDYLDVIQREGTDGMPYLPDRNTASGRTGDDSESDMDDLRQQFVDENEESEAEYLLSEYIPDLLGDDGWVRWSELDDDQRALVMEHHGMGDERMARFISNSEGNDPWVNLEDPEDIKLERDAENAYGGDVGTMARESLWDNAYSMTDEELADQLGVSLYDAFDAGDTKYGEYFTPGATDYTEHIFRHQPITDTASNFRAPTDGHWDNPTLFHARSGMFPVAGEDGDLAWHLGEVQSDAAQIGKSERERGIRLATYDEEAKLSRAGWETPRSLAWDVVTAAGEALTPDQFLAFMRANPEIDAWRNTPAMARVPLTQYPMRERPTGTFDPVTGRVPRALEPSSPDAPVSPDLMRGNSYPQERPVAGSERLYLNTRERYGLDEIQRTENMVNRLRPSLVLSYEDEYYPTTPGAGAGAISAMGHAMRPPQDGLPMDYLNDPTAAFFEREAQPGGLLARLDERIAEGPELDRIREKTRPAMPYGGSTDKWVDAIIRDQLEQATNAALRDDRVTHLTFGTGQMAKEMTYGDLAGQEAFYDGIVRRRADEVLRRIDPSLKLGETMLTTKSSSGGTRMKKVPSLELTPENLAVILRKGIPTWALAGLAFGPAINGASPASAQPRGLLGAMEDRR